MSGKEMEQMGTYSKILELKNLVQKKKQINCEMQRLKTPLIDDLRHVKTIYSIWMDLLRPKALSPDKVYNRNKFIFAILYFYSPITLAGGVTEKGVREEIAKTIGVKSLTAISNNIGEVVFLYSYYNDFRVAADYICSEVQKRLSVLKIE